MSARGALAVFALAFLARAVNIAFLSAPAGEFFMDDSSGYWREAGELLEKGWFHWVGGDGSTLLDRRPPLYMYFLGLVRALFGASLTAAATVQAVLDSMTCVVIALLGGLLRPRIGLVAGILAALWPNLIIHSALIVSDTLFLFLFTPLLYAGARFVMNGDWRWMLAAGLFFGFAVMTRNAIQFLPPPPPPPPPRFSWWRSLSRFARAGAGARQFGPCSPSPSRRYRCPARSSPAMP